MPLSSPVSLPRPSENVDSKEGRHRGPLPGGRVLPREVLRTISTSEKTPCLYRRRSPCPGLLKSWTPKKSVIGDLFSVATINTCEKTPCRYRRRSPCPGLLKTWTPKK